MDLLIDKGLVPNISSEVDAIIIPYEESLRPVACQVANMLRLAGFSIDVQLLPKKNITWCFQYSDRIGAKHAIFIAPDEWSRREVRIKFLKLQIGTENKEENIIVDNLVDYCKENFGKK